jgi:hypothetical protein
MTLIPSDSRILTPGGKPVEIALLLSDTVVPAADNVRDDREV